jgi:hypothetical protein
MIFIEFGLRRLDTAIYLDCGGLTPLFSYLCDLVQENTRRIPIVKAASSHPSPKRRQAAAVQKSNVMQLGLFSQGTIVIEFAQLKSIGPWEVYKVFVGWLAREVTVFVTEREMILNFDNP